ncbi:hypothetical protein [Mucilaginibacter xinganensis]|nr:hypothetical protein [Mucilaginibacter xinganensis]
MNTSDSSTTKTIIHAFEQIEAALNLKLKQQGYAIRHQNDGDTSFGNRHLTWLNDKQALRLSLDSNEGKFILDIANTLPLSPKTMWAHVLSIPYNPHKHDEHYVITIAVELMDSL